MEVGKVQRQVKRRVKDDAGLYVFCAVGASILLSNEVIYALHNLAGVLVVVSPIVVGVFILRTFGGGKGGLTA